MSLADFYGIAPSTAADVPAGGGAAVGSDDADGDDAGRSSGGSRTSLASAEFDSRTYLTGLLAQKTMRDLIQHDNQMIASKRALDSEMQTLVYENYNKFISATDMIRKMKSNVESMEHQMANLLTNMNAISTNCQGIEASLTPNRAKVENLLGVSRLLKRLEFLFELPGKLRKAIELGAYEQAVKYFRISSAILEQYKHHKSFEHIRQESEQIIGELKGKLRGLIREPALSADQQMSYTAMLVMDLGEPDSPQLISALIEAQRAKFQTAMSKAVEVASKAAQRRASVHQAERKDEADGATSPTSGSSASSTSTDGNLLLLLQQYFLTPYVIFADTYLSTLVRPYESKRQKLTAALADQKQQAAEDAAAGLKPKPTTGAAQSATVDSATVSLQHLTTALHLSQDGLTALTVDLFNAYFTLARRELLKRATIGGGVGVGAGVGGSGGRSDASQVILGFTATLKAFYDGLSRPLQLLPRAKLADRAQELVHHALTHCVEVVCEHVLATCVAKLLGAHEAVLHWRPHGGYTGQLVSPTAVSSELRAAVEEGLGLLVVVLSTREYLPEAVAAGLSFSELARAHAAQLLQHLAREIAFRTPKRQDLVHDASALAPTALSKAIDEKLAKKAGGGDPRDARTPLFYLFLCQVAHQQETKDIPAALRTLAKFFPPAAPSGRARRSSGALPDGGDPLAVELLARAKESTQGLLLRYCETHGFRVTDIVRTSLVVHGATGEPRHPSEFVASLQGQFRRVAAELTLIFPRARGDDHVHERNHDSSGRDLLGRGNLQTSRAGGGKDGKGLPGARGGASGGGGGGINRELQRLFTQKIVTFPGCDANGVVTDLAMDRTQPMVAIGKIAFKAMTECVRAERLSVGAFHQLQLDLFTLRHELLHFLPESAASSSASSSSSSSSSSSGSSVASTQELFVLLDEALNASHERAPNVAPLDDYQVEDIYHASRAQRPPSSAAGQEEPASEGPAETDASSSEEASSFYSAAVGVGGASSSSSSSAAPTGALARLVLSSPHTTRSDHLSPTDVMQKAHARDTTTQA